MADTGDQLLREIDEDLRREQMLKLWRTWGRYVVAVAVVVVLGVVGYVGWKEWRQSQLAADAHAYWLADRMELLGDRDGAAAAFGELAEDGAAGYPVLARLREAQALARAGDGAGAVTAYDAVAADQSAPRAYRLLGNLYAAMVLLDGGPAAEIESRLAPVAADGSPWRHSAMEIQGLLALRDGDTDGARAIFAALADDPQTPTTLRNRAGQLLAMLGGA